MVTIKEFAERMGKVEAEARKAAEKIILKYNNEVVSLQNRQLLKGKDIHGETMQNGYSPAYGKLRRKKGLQTSFVDLKFTGKYQRSKKLVKYSYGVDIRSDADYEAHLRANFPDHVGLNVENSEYIAEKMAEELGNEMKKYLTK